ncbi:MAG: GAF domain-containing protein, partial [Chloroflexaceae bacterium]|nr:GAF domain-containing protein [Chloroflexaceae bacterium]
MRTSAILQMTSAIETAATLDELLLLSLSELSNLLDIPRSGILLVRDDQTTQMVSSFPPSVNLPPPIPLTETPNLAHVIQTRQPLQIHNIANAPVNAFSLLTREEGIQSVLMVPLVAHDKVAGVLVLGSLESQREFTDNEIAMARMLTGQLAAAITSFRTTEEAKRRTAELATLNDIAAAVTSSLDTREVYHTVVQQLNEYFQVDAGSLLMRDDTTGDLEFVMTLEAGEEKLAGVRVPRGQGVAGYVAENQQYAIVQDAQNDPRFYSKVSDDVGYPTRSILCVPMIVKGRTIGIIELLNKNDGDFTDSDARRLTRMAATIGVAIENARLFQQVMTGRDQVAAILNSSHDGILMADTLGFVAIANPMAARIFQTTADDLIGRQLDDLFEQMKQRAREVSMPIWLND